MAQLVGGGLIGVGASVYSYLVGSSTVKVGDTPSFWIVIGIIHLVQIISFIPAILFATERFFDLIGGLSFVLGSIICINIQPELNLKQIIALGFLNIWALRLAFFLFFRIIKEKQDIRFRGVKTSGPKFFMVWMTQALWVTLNAGPIYLMILNRSKDNEIGTKELIGIGLFILGFLLEVIADNQKFSFRQQIENRNKFITDGLWRYSRHPNYCGEILLWIGLSLLSLGSLHESQRWAALICPIFTYLLVTRICGVDMLEEQNDKQWGGQPAYQQYKKQTPILFPGTGTGSNSKSK